MANKTYSLEDIRRLKHITALKMEAERIGIRSITRQMFTPCCPKLSHPKIKQILMTPDLWKLVSWNGVMNVCKFAARAVTVYKTVSSVFRLFRTPKGHPKIR